MTRLLMLIALGLATPALAHPPSANTEAHPTTVEEVAPPAFPNIVRKKGEFAAVKQPFVPTNKMLSSAENASGILFYETILAPGTPGSPPHIHVEDEEFFYVAKGSLDVMSGDEVMRLGEGGFAALLPGTPHMFWNASDQETTIIMAVSGGHFEDFFDNVGEMLETLKPANMEEAGPLIAEFAAKHGTIIDMSLMPEAAAPYYIPK